MKKITFLFALVFLTACSTDDDAGTSLSLEDRLLGTWQYVALLIDGQDLGLEEDHCVFDNKITFRTNNEVFYEFVTLNCDAIESEEFWLPQSDNTFISVMPGDDEGIVFTVNFINDNKFNLTYTLDEGDPEISIDLERR